MPATETPRNPWFWTVLTLLHERPMHPYEIQQLTRQRGKDLFAEHKKGSLYSVIDRLRREELISTTETNRDGNLPERTIYRITDAGRARFLGWLHGELGEPDERDLPRFAFAVEKIAHLDPATAAGLLRTRIAGLERQLADLDALRRGTAKRGVRPVSVLEIDYAHTLRRAELRWLRRVTADIDSGRLDWPTIDASKGDNP